MELLLGQMFVSLAVLGSFFKLFELKTGEDLVLEGRSELVRVSVDVSLMVQLSRLEYIMTKVLFDEVCLGVSSTAAVLVLGLRVIKYAADMTGLLVEQVGHAVFHGREIKFVSNDRVFERFNDLVLL